MLAVAVAYLRALEAGGIALDAARRMIYFRLAADADQFLTIAKFRALRKLWARVEQACGLAPAPAFVSAETAWRMMTRRDPYVNMLRTTIAAFSAGLGGADAITVLPFTAALGLPDRFARRIARNTQLMLLEESNLAKVADPAAGSGGIEDLTEQLCRAAWALFQEIEKAGGAAAALEAGPDPEQGRGDARRAREGRRAPQGCADRHQRVSRHLTKRRCRCWTSSRVPLASGRARSRSLALPRIRLAEPFEALRDASDRMLAEDRRAAEDLPRQSRQLADFTRAHAFAKNFFEAGGIEAVTNDGFASRDAMIAAFKASGAKLACLCSSDRSMRPRPPTPPRRWRRPAPRTSISPAARANSKPRCKAAGVQDFIFVGCDVLATLRARTASLGIWLHSAAGVDRPRAMVGPCGEQRSMLAARDPGRVVDCDQRHVDLANPVRRCHRHSHQAAARRRSSRSQASIVASSSIVEVRRRASRSDGIALADESPCSVEQRIRHMALLSIVALPARARHARMIADSGIMRRHVASARCDVREPPVAQMLDGDSDVRRLAWPLASTSMMNVACASGSSRCDDMV